MFSNPRFTKVPVLIVLVLSLLAMVGCDNSENEAKIKDLNSRIRALKSQHAQLNQAFITVKEKQGWFRNNVLPDTAEVKALSEKIKKVESEIAAAETELARIKTGSDDAIMNAVDIFVSIFTERGRK